MIRFIHCADLHLGKSIGTVTKPTADLLKLMKKANYLSFEKIIQIAIEKKVDFILLSGDVYDTEQRSIKGQWFLKKQAERLHEEGIPLYIIHGNHDPLVRDLDHTSFPKNVHVFSQEVEAVRHVGKEGDLVYLYGFSYPSKGFFDNPAPLYKRINDDHAFHIALLHGQEKGQTDHEPYAPFSLSELKAKQFDYWALGHIHKRQILSHAPYIVYSGNIQGTNRKETGEKGAYLVEMTKAETSLKFINTTPLQWERPVFYIDHLQSLDELLEQIESYFFQLTNEKNYILHIQIEGSGPLHELLYERRVEEELLQTIQDTMSQENIHVDRLELKTNPSYDREKLRKQDNIFGDIVKITDTLKENEESRELVKPIYDHPLLRKYVNKINDDEWEVLIQAAEKKVLTALLSEVKDNGNY